MSNLFSFDIINTLLAIAVTINAVFAVVVYSRNRRSITHKLFFTLIVTISMWVVSMFLLRVGQWLSLELQVLLAQLLFFSAAMIPTICMYFAHSFPNKNTPFSWWQKYLVPVFIVAISILIWTPDIFILNVSNGATILTNSNLHTVYSVYVIGFFLLSYFILLTRAYKEKNKLLKTRLMYVFLGALIPAIVGIVTNIILPHFNISEYNWIGPVSTILSSGILTYSILRHRLFDVRIITTEILMFILWVITFIQILTFKTISGILTSTLIFILMVFIGILLIRSIIKEVKTREQLEVLTKELKDANERLKQLDQLKTEFLSIATHQLRTPLTAIKGYLSMVTEGGYGEVPEQIQKVLKNISNSSSLMAETIEDFMNVSRIELGHIKYTMQNFNCIDLIIETVNELRPRTEKAGLKLSFKNDNFKKSSLIVRGDYGKIKYIFSNLIENAIKYTPKGSITVSIDVNKKEKTARTIIKDTGIGIAKEEIDKLFSKFKRARNAHNINIKGAGLGLYVANEMAKAHNGKILAESEGEGKGSSFIIELPLVGIENAKES